MADGGTAVERNREWMNVLLDCNKNGDVTTGFVTSYQQVRATVTWLLVLVVVVVVTFFDVLHASAGLHFW